MTTTIRKRAFSTRLSFTLIELLVVMSIIAVLASLLVPTVKSAKDKANAVKCMNNLRQIGLAVMLYGETYRYYPWTADQVAETTWAYAINQYLGGDRLPAPQWIYPNLRKPVVSCPSMGYRPTNVVAAYALHERILGNTYAGHGAPIYPRPYPFDQRPTQLILGADAGQNPANLGGEANAALNFTETAQDFDESTGDNTVSPGPDLDDSVGQIRWRHNGSANFVFMDGHVESRTKSQLYERNVKMLGP